MRGTFALLFLAIAFTGCHPRVKPDGTAVPVADGSVTIKIVNSNALDVVMYVSHDAYRDRLGVATAATTTTYLLKFSTLGAGHEFQLLADPVGSREPFRSEIVHPQDGQILTWTLESDFARSHLTIF